MKILHLYYDLLNNNGEHGNIIAIKDYLDFNKIKYNIDYLTIDDDIDLNVYDLIYIGSGSKVSLEIALKDLIKYKKEFKEYINKNKFILATGNSVDLFGKSLFINGDKLEGLNVLDFKLKELDDYYRGDTFSHYKGMDDIILFNIRNTEFIENKEKPIFKDNDSFIKNNFYGISSIGPILIRNPHFTNYFLKELSDFNNIKYNKVILDKYTNAYNEYISQFKV